MEHALRQDGLANAIVVTGATKREIFAVPAPGTVDRLAADFSDKSKWNRSSCWLAKLQHHGVEGWRATGKWSLHVIVYHTQSGIPYYYGLHLDHWEGSLRHPGSAAFHIAFEFVPHFVTRMGTRQNGVARGLDKRDAKMGAATGASAGILHEER